MIERFVKRSEFKDYEDFLNNFEVSVPKNFNFGFDVVDFWAKKEPNRIALKVFDTSKNSIDFTFAYSGGYPFSISGDIRSLPS